MTKDAIVTSSASLTHTLTFSLGRACTRTHYNRPGYVPAGIFIFPVDVAENHNPVPLRESCHKNSRLTDAASIEWYKIVLVLQMTCYFRLIPALHRMQITFQPERHVFWI